MAEDSPRKPLSDDELVRFVQSGDRRAMNELVDRHHGVVFRTCVAILNDEDLAADASQICFIKAFRAIDRFRGEAAIRTWLLAIAGNEARGLLARSRGRESRASKTLHLLRPQTMIRPSRLRFTPKLPASALCSLSFRGSRGCP